MGKRGMHMMLNSYGCYDRKILHESCANFKPLEIECRLTSSVN